jgi:hypothetical protein
VSSLLSLQIDRFVDNSQPGFVECSLVDAYGARHLFVEKVPVVTAEDLWSDSDFPRQGVIACEIEREFAVDVDQPLLQVNTELPWHVESTTGETRFVVRMSQVRTDRVATVAPHSNG